MKFKSVIILISIALTFSCNISNDKKLTLHNEEVSFQKPIEFSDKIPNPQSTELVNSLMEAGAGYIYDITNPPENKDKYLTQTQQALNLGVYSADLCYITIYQKKDAIAEYLQSFGELINALNINPPEKNILDRIESNIDNKDSLINIINEVHETANVILTESERSEIGLLVLVGSWIEGMYLTKQTMEFASNVEPLWNIIDNNKGTLSKINNLLSNVDTPSPDLEKIIISLKDIEKIFIKIQSDTNNAKLKEKLIISINDLRESIV